MTHVFNWVEIPTRDFDRAVDFYAVVFGREIDLYEPDSDEASEGRAAMFDTDEGDVSGMLFESDTFTTESGATISYEPTDGGLVVYFVVDGPIDDALSRATEHGGTVLVPKEPIPEMGGHFAIIRDPEGNRVGLMSSE